MKKLIYIIIGAGLFLTSCKSNMNPTAGSAGDADFTKYVSIGNSLTAGYANNSLYRSGQENSFPNILSQQFSLVGGGAFTQPLLPGNSGWPGPKLILGYSTDCQGVIGLGPVPFSGTFDTAGSSTIITTPFNNYGVPGIRGVDITFPLSLYGLANPYAKRMFGLSNSSYTDEVVAADPTFFTVWLGNNDVLGYATNGGEGNVGGLGIQDISPLSTFQQNYEALIEKLMAGGNAKGALINIPDVTSIPFFTTIPINGLVLTAQQAQMLNQAYAPLGISFNEGPNNFIIEDPSAPGGRRQIQKGEYLLLTLPQDSLKCGQWGSVKPIPKQYVLSADEVENVRSATTQFNEVIAQQAAKYNLALVDANSHMKNFDPGMYWDGVNYSLTFVTGGLFSLDGVHLTPRGYAMFANQVIRVINSQYHATIPLANVNSFDGLLFP